MDLVIKIYKEYESARIPKKAHEDDAGYDVFAFNKVTILPGKREIVPIGVRIISPKGYYYTFAPRSSLAFRYNLVPSHHNVMDPGYTGSCGVLMFNRGVGAYDIEKGDRFCQLIFHKVFDQATKEIDETEYNEITTARSEKGFGSSGK
jgi:dUTP pyrophosphatase